METRKAAFAAGATLMGVGMLAARSHGSKMHEHCKDMVAGKCAPSESTQGERAERKCPPGTPCGGRMNTEEPEGVLSAEDYEAKGAVRWHP